MVVMVVTGWRHIDLSPDALFFAPDPPQRPPPSPPALECVFLPPAPAWCQVGKERALFSHPLPASALGIWPGGCGGEQSISLEVSISIVFFLWGISRLSRPELPIDRVETDLAFLVPKEQSADPHRLGHG